MGHTKLGAALSPADIEELDNAGSPNSVRATRYPEQMMALLGN